MTQRQCGVWFEYLDKIRDSAEDGVLTTHEGRTGMRTAHPAARVADGSGHVRRGAVGLPRAAAARHRACQLAGFDRGLGAVAHHRETGTYAATSAGESDIIEGSRAIFLLRRRILRVYAGLTLRSAIDLEGSTCVIG